MIVRLATEADLESWLQMRNPLWPGSSATHRKDLENYFANQSKDIEACFLVEVKGVPVGFIEVNVRNYAAGSDRPEVPYVEGWFIAETHRGQGLGKLLMQRAENWAMERGYSELASDAELENLISINVHKKLGFEETDRIVCFLKKLNSP